MRKEWQNLWVESWCTGTQMSHLICRRTTYRRQLYYCKHFFAVSWHLKIIHFMQKMHAPFKVLSLGEPFCTHELYIATHMLWSCVSARRVTIRSLIFWCKLFLLKHKTELTNSTPCWGGRWSYSHLPWNL